MRNSEMILKYKYQPDSFTENKSNKKQSSKTLDKADIEMKKTIAMKR